ncbi:hypothetical protein J6590_027550 [Homalodisca vitripennis]|nr:hypothetical protein J6590_027550 [Homalodisca vitripennis]
MRGNVLRGLGRGVGVGAHKRISSGVVVSGGGGVASLEHLSDPFRVPPAPGSPYITSSRVVFVLQDFLEGLITPVFSISSWNIFNYFVISWLENKKIERAATQLSTGVWSLEQVPLQLSAIVWWRVAGAVGLDRLESATASHLQHATLLSAAAVNPELANVGRESDKLWCGDVWSKILTAGVRTLSKHLQQHARCYKLRL